MDSSMSNFRIHFRSYQYLADQHKAFKRTVRPDLGQPESGHRIALAYVEHQPLYIFSPCSKF